MKPANGQILRRLGLMIETVSLLGLFMMVRHNVGPRKFAGVSQSQALTAALVLGFVLWVVGTTQIYWPRRSRPSD